MTASRLRANVTAPLWLLSSPPMAVLAQQLSAQSLASGSRLTINPLDTEILDTGGGHSDSANPFRFYCPTSGWWLVRGAIPYSGATTNNNFCFGSGIQTNISAVSSNYDGARHAGPSSSTAVVMPAFTDLLRLSAANPVTSGDEIQMYGFQDTGGSVSLAINVAVGVFPWLTARWAGVQSGTGGLPVPSPAAFADVTEITGAFLNSNLRDTVNFLAYPPMARLKNEGASQSVTSGTDTAVTWASANVNGYSSDNYSGWSGSGGKYTFPVDGRYYVYGQVAFPGSNTGQWQCGLRVNGTTTWYGTRTSAPGTSTAGLILSAERYLRVSATDYVEVMATQTTGSPVTLATSAPAYSKLVVLWRGA
jgi:hypothetical protein